MKPVTEMEETCRFDYSAQMNMHTPVDQVLGSHVVQMPTEMDAF